MATKTFTNNGLGKIYCAPADTVVGSTVSAILAAITAESSVYVDLGTIQSDGLTVSPRVVDTTLTDWNGNDVEQSVHGEWKVKFLDMMNAEVMKAALGADNVTVESSDCKTVYDGGMAEAMVFVAVMKDGDKARIEVLRNGKCNNFGDIKYTDGEYSAADLTFKSEKPSDNGSQCFCVSTTELDAE